VRDLAQPETLKSAVLAAALTSIACYPRLLLWTKRAHPLWYLEATIFLGAIVLWAFVFAWHSKYCKRPVFTLKLRGATVAAATLAGVLGALALHFFLDPALRLRTPEDYPSNLREWMAITLFTLGFSQLFLLFAPFAWLLRLLRNRRAAAVLTVLFGVFVLVIKTSSSPQPYPAALFAALLLARILSGCLGVYFYLRGGVLLVWWLGLLIEARHLISIAD
jgi:hypothetical protein